MNRQDWIDRNIEITPEMGKVFDYYEKCYIITEGLEPFSSEWLTKVVHFREANYLDEELAKEMYNRQCSFDLGEE